MSEKTPRPHNHEVPREYEADHETQFTPEGNKSEHESQHDAHEAQKARERSLEQATKAAEQHSRSIEEIDPSIRKTEHKNNQDNAPVNPQLKEHAKEQGFKKIRRQLPFRDRAFSKTIHQPVVEAVSEVAEHTVARPSGLLAGGLFSMFSSLGILIIAKYYGYEYNFFIGIATFVVGFFIGVFLEFLLRLLRRSS